MSRDPSTVRATAWTASSRRLKVAPPPYVNANAINDEDLTIGSTEWPLPATLTMPAGTGPFPVVILVHGSGPNDRDETIGPNRPFKDLALGLASHAALPCCARTKGERDYQVTMEEFARWKTALGARPDVTFHSYPALNHLFIAGSGKITPAEYSVAGHVAEDVIRDIACWAGGQC